MSTPSKLPTPKSRQSLSSSTAIPTPTRRRSIAPNTPSSQIRVSTPDGSHEMASLQEAMRNRPPSSLGGSRMLGLGRPGSSASGVSGEGGEGREGYHTPPQYPSGLGVSSMGPPRTPASARARTPSGLPNRSRQSIGTPSTSRAPSIGGTFTPRRTSMAVSSGPAPNTPTHRSESRMSTRQQAAVAWDPKVGDAVRIASMGMEGTLRYIGQTEFKEGVWAGVELEGGFAGRGKNDGMVQDKRYFTCPENCGVFVAASKLSAPEVRPPSARPGSSASSLHSGRQTPAFSLSGRETPAFISEDPMESPSYLNGKAGASTSQAPLRGSTRGNVHTGGQKKTESEQMLDRVQPGSRAAALANLSVKQLKDRQAAASALELGKSVLQGIGSSTGAATPSKLMSSTATTPRASRISIGGPVGVRTPNRMVSSSAAELKTRMGNGRESVGGGGFSTPKAPGARTGRTSVAGGGRQSALGGNHDMGPPPVPASPSKYAAGGRQTPVGRNEELIAAERANAELMLRVRELEEERDKRDEVELGTREGLEKGKKETDQRIRELSIAGEFAGKEVIGLKVKLEQLQDALNGKTREEERLAKELEEVTGKVAEKEAALGKAKRDLEIQKERAETELEKGMEIKRKEIRDVEEKLAKAENQAEQRELMIQELRSDAMEITAIMEVQTGDLRVKNSKLENELLQMSDSLAEMKRAAALAESKPKGTLSEAELTDMATLQADVEHYRSRTDAMIIQIGDLQEQSQLDMEAFRKTQEKTRDNEKRLKEEIKSGRTEVQEAREQTVKAKERIDELEVALKENNSALESARAEIEGYRVEQSDLENLRTAAKLHVKVEAERDTLQEKLAKSREKVEELEAELVVLQGQREVAESLQQKCASQEAELAKFSASVKELSTKHSLPLPPSERKDSAESNGSRKPRVSGGLLDGDKSLRGFQYIIQELNKDNAELKQQLEELQSEKVTLEIALLDCQQTLEESMATSERATTAAESGAHLEELERARKEHQLYKEDAEAQIKDLITEIENFERLVESNTFAKEELEDQLEKAREDLDELKRKTDGTTGAARPSSSSSSLVGCPLCEGPHDLNDCPAANAGDSWDSDSPTAHRGLQSAMSNGSKATMPCMDCGMTDHKTEACPNSQDVF